MNSRNRILRAAGELFAKHGFRGATTRLIAQQAGVNEVTIFRAFGSKENLIAEAVRLHADEANLPPLPDVPFDPEKELTHWCDAHLAHLRASRALIRTCMGELEDRPVFGPEAAHGPSVAGQQLGSYLVRLRQQNLIATDVNLHASIAMLLGAIFADAMGRDMMPAMFPQPPHEAAAQYTRLFLRSLGFHAAKARDSKGRTADTDNSQTRTQTR